MIIICCSSDDFSRVRNDRDCPAAGKDGLENISAILYNVCVIP